MDIQPRTWRSDQQSGYKAYGPIERDVSVGTVYREATDTSPAGHVGQVIVGNHIVWESRPHAQPAVAFAEVDKHLADAWRQLLQGGGLQR